MKVTAIRLPKGWAGWTSNFVWEEGWGPKATRQLTHVPAAASGQRDVGEGEKRANKRKHEVIKTSNQAETGVNCADAHEWSRRQRR